MSDLRTDLERLGERASVTPDAFERLDRRRRRRERNRRIGAGVLAFVLVVGGSLAAFSAFRSGDDQTVGGGRADGFFALWPEPTQQGLAAAQDAVDAGDPAVAWRADPTEVVRRFATERLLWPEVTVSLQDGSNPETDEVLFYDLESVGHSCPFGASAAECGSASASVVLERLGRADGLWSVTEVHSEGLSLPLVPGDDVAAGTTISIPTTLRNGDEASVGVAFLAACNVAGIDENVVAQGGALEFQIPAVPDGCTGYVYVMLPKAEAGAVAIGSLLFTDAPAQPSILWFVQAISAVPVRFVNDAPAGVAKFTCDASGELTPTRSVVAAQPDGVHIAVTNTGDVTASFSVGELGGDGAQPGETKKTVWQLPPGSTTVSCSIEHEDGGGVATPANLTVVDPDGLFVPAELECPTGEAYGGASAYAEGATGAAGEPLDVVNEHLTGLEPGDQVELAGYPQASEPVVRIVRAGAIVGTVKLFDDGSGGWLVSEVDGCGGTQFGWSEAPTGVSGPAGTGSVFVVACAPVGPGKVNIHDGTDLQVDGQGLGFDTDCLRSPAGVPLTISFNNLDQGVLRNISIYPMDPCLEEALTAATDTASCELGRPVFSGEIVTGVGEIVYQLGPLEFGNYYFQDDVHPQAHGFLIVG